MNPRLIIGLSLVFAVLTACAPKTTVTYTVTANVPDSARKTELFEASERMLERRLSAADVKKAQVIVVPTEGNMAKMTVEVEKAADTDVVARILAEPFTFDIRLEGPKVTPTEDNPEGTNWIQTGVDGSMLTWIAPVTSSSNEIGVELQFTEAGLTKLNESFKGNKGKNIGIFVRDLLVSKMSIADEAVNDHIIIGGIPSAFVAQIFSDDVNVGLHVTFTPES